MVRKVLIEVFDDIDGTVATQTVSFALDGVAYEIDLSADNAAVLRAKLERYVEAGRRVGGRRVRTAAGHSSADAGTAGGGGGAGHSRRIRAWALDNGYQIATIGRISDEIYTAYESRTPAPEPATVLAPRRLKGGG